MKNNKIIFATSNEGKMKEVRMILADLGMEVLSMKQAGAVVDLVEDGETFAANAIIKATAIQAVTGGIVLADDSGLEVDYMDKAPGVYSARFMGEDTSYDIKNQAIIDRLEKAVGEERSARFVCVIAAALPGGEVLTTRGTIEGQIGYEIVGDNGFGYDPIFLLPERGITTAQLSAEEKNEISHRGKALTAMKALLKERMGENA